jgi:formate dehydrogenase maturation protein FdhE
LELPEILDNARQSMQLLQGGADLADSLRKLFRRSGGEEVSEVERDEILRALQDALLDAKSAQVTVLDKLIELKIALLEHDKTAKLESRYALKQIGKASFVRELRIEFQHEEPLHSICPACADKGVKSIVSFTDMGPRCPQCENWL